MTITFNEAEKILKTLPVGYYLKKNIEVELQDSFDTYFLPMQDKIVIGFKAIEKVVNQLTEEKDKEYVIRTLQYHEISHAILTPLQLSMSDIVNTFEDERIESILRNFYIGVDFKTFVRQINNFHGETPSSAFELFYQIVRYRVGPKEFVQEVHDLIMKHKSINSMSTNSHWEISDYRDDIYEFYRKVENYFNANQLPTESQQSNNSEQAETSSNESNNESSNSMNSSSEKKENENSNSSQSLNSSSEANDLELNEMMNAECGSVESIVKEVVNAYVDEKMTQDFELLLNSINKTSKRNGSAINAYSGVFDPRSVARDDYKYFVQQNRIGHVKQFSKLHFNLFIDRSGSFRPNEMIVNKLLYALSKLEKTNPNFEFDLISIGIGQTEHDKTDKKLACSGGTWLTKTIFNEFKKHQLSNMQVINVVLFDGYAFCSAPMSERVYEEKNFMAFDSKNTIIISDKENEKCISKYCTKAKTIFTKNYTEELYSSILQNLQLLAR